MRGTVLALSVGLVALVGMLDYLTGGSISFSIFYLLPVSLVAWRLGLRWGTSVAAASTVIWWVAERATAPLPLSQQVTAWNAIMRFGIFMLVTITLCRLRAALRHNELLARTDHLTGLLNSRGFFERAETEIALARRTGDGLTVVFLDLDDFKAINLQLGHTGANGLLTQWGAEVARRVRTADVVARLGGDEFALLLSTTRADSVQSVLERLWEELAQAAASLPAPVAFTMGAVTFTTPPASIDAMLHRADMLMYSAKAGGKNRWVHEEFPPSGPARDTRSQPSRRQP